MLENIALWTGIVFIIFLLLWLSDRTGLAEEETNRVHWFLIGHFHTKAMAFVSGMVFAILGVIFWLSIWLW